MIKQDGLGAADGCIDCGRIQAVNRELEADTQQLPCVLCTRVNPTSCWFHDERFLLHPAGTKQGNYSSANFCEGEEEAGRRGRGGGG